MERKTWMAWAILGAIALGGLLGVEVASRWFSADARAIRDCPATYWTCESHAGADARIEGTEKPSFLGEARGCVQFRAWEAAAHRALFDCQVSTRAETGSCHELETTCELTEPG